MISHKEFSVGILALQGNYQQHANITADAFANTGLKNPLIITLITDIRSLAGHAIDALILPGGESSTMRVLLHEKQLFRPLQSLIEKKTPVLATCAGAILLAKHILKQHPDPVQESEQRERSFVLRGTHANEDLMATTFPVADITVDRNGYGGQMYSFTADIETTLGFSISGAFIRAPIITHAGPRAKVLAVYRELPVIVQQDTILLSTFHPESVNDTQLHEYFFRDIAVPKEKPKFF